MKASLRRTGNVWLLAGIFLLVIPRAVAHPFDSIQIDLALRDDRIEAKFVCSPLTVEDELPELIRAKVKQDEAALAEHKQRWFEIVTARFELAADGEPLTAAYDRAELVLEDEDIFVYWHYPVPRPPRTMTAFSHLSPMQPEMSTFLNLYRGEELLRQELFPGDMPITVEFEIDQPQGRGEVIMRFLREGVHHIFIGPDHILFIIGLLLLGGTLGHLLKIVTAFTVAHSITLVLATLAVVNPPASLIEPAIALSIVVVGVHSLLVKHEKRTRMIFAFGFGLIHGFGFASVLRKLELPGEALAWSLASFNVGVEIGQACIVLAIAPLLALLRNQANPKVSKAVLHVASIGVIAGGGYWLIERVVALV